MIGSEQFDCPETPSFQDQLAHFGVGELLQIGSSIYRKMGNEEYMQVDEVTHEPMGKVLSVEGLSDEVLWSEPISPVTPDENGVFSSYEWLTEMEESAGQAEDDSILQDQSNRTRKIIESIFENPHPFPRTPYKQSQSNSLN